MTGRTSHEVRGLKYPRNGGDVFKSPRRTSHEVRGLKLTIAAQIPSNQTSHLTRGAWIEIFPAGSERVDWQCRTSHEVRGLKLRIRCGGSRLVVVAPHTRCVD